MKVRVFALCAALGCAAALAFAPVAGADEAKDPKPADRPDQPDQQPADPPRDRPADEPSDQQPADKPADAAETKETEANVIRFENDVRLNVQHDVSTGALTFRAADPSVRLAQPPVVLVGTREYPLVMAEPGVWRVSNEAFRVATLSDAKVRIVADGRTFTSPLVLRTSATRLPTATTARFGGQVVRLSECNAEVEVVRDPATGMLTLHPVGTLKIVEAPSVVVTTTEEKSPTTVSFTKVDGQGNVWRVTHPTFRTTTTTTTTTTTAMPTARIRVLVDGRTCEAPLVWTSRRGGQMITVNGGPRFEVVPDPANRTYTFYAVDEVIDGRPYVVENPQVVVRTGEGTRTYTLAPVPGEQRAWRMVGLDAGVREPLDGMLRFTLGGRSLETSVGLSGLHVGVR
jgi:hypothetical protein